MYAMADKTNHRASDQRQLIGKYFDCLLNKVKMQPLHYPVVFLKLWRPRQTGGANKKNKCGKGKRVEFEGGKVSP